ncbi:MAG: hypothetical protein IH923_13035 [Nitrospinae bacterium]|nr:hypothetical protein [Nitrospinota bacterium]
MNFGKYRVGKNIIQVRGLDRALLIQKTDRVPLGQLALQNGSIDNKLTANACSDPMKV